MMVPTGLSAYPSDACYDPGRLSWYPYWLDNPTEAACIWTAIIKTGQLGSGGSLLIPPPLPTAPQTEEELLSWTPEQIYQAQHGQWEQWKVANRAAMPYEGVVGKEFEEENAPVSTLAQWWEKNKWFVLGAGIGVLAVAQLTKR